MMRWAGVTSVSSKSFPWVKAKWRIIVILSLLGFSHSGQGKGFACTIFFKLLPNIFFDQTFVLSVWSYLWYEGVKYPVVVRENMVPQVGVVLANLPNIFNNLSQIIFFQNFNSNLN